MEREGRPLSEIRDRVHVIPNFVETDLFRPAPEGKTPGSIAFAGRLRDAKGVPDLIRAVGLLASEGREVRLSVFGDGEAEYLKALRELAPC